MSRQSSANIAGDTGFLTASSALLKPIVQNVLSLLRDCNRIVVPQLTPMLEQSYDLPLFSDFIDERFQTIPLTVEDLLRATTCSTEFMLLVWLIEDMSSMADGS